VKTPLSWASGRPTQEGDNISSGAAGPVHLFENYRCDIAS